jgi:predicted dehydrogenase
MIAACRRAGKQLMIGYRSQYEPHNLAGDPGRAERGDRPGELRRSRTTASRSDRAPGGTQKALSGGGSLYDIGIYSLQAARYLTGEEPTQVWATIHSPAGDPRFKEVEDTVHFTLRFPSGAIANLSSGYSWAGMNRYHVVGDRGTLEAEPATSYGGHRLTIKGQPAQVTPLNQFAAQMDHLSECIQTNRPVKTPGEEGMRDIRIMQAIYESARTGRPLRL